jgi:putative transcriptional regulator
VSPRRHPADAILAAYASGALSPGFDLVTAAHLERCAACRRTVRLFEAAGGEMLTEAPASEVAPDALARLMARIDGPPEESGPIDRRPLHERLPVKPRRWLAPGVWVQAVDVPHATGDRVYFVRLPAGLKGFRHGHNGAEFTTVISGALNDGGEILRPGDFIEHDADHVHQPVIEPDDGGCLCLAATEGPLRTSGLIDRILQALVGI